MKWFETCHICNKIVFRWFQYWVRYNKSGKYAHTKCYMRTRWDIINERNNKSR